MRELIAHSAKTDAKTDSTMIGITLSAKMAARYKLQWDAAWLELLTLEERKKKRTSYLLRGIKLPASSSPGPSFLHIVFFPESHTIDANDWHGITINQ